MGVVQQEAFSVAFDRTTRGPIALLVGSRGDLMRSLRVVITDGFNDPAATISIGTGSDVDAVMRANEILPGVAGEYARTLAYRLPVAGYIYFFLNARSSTTGRGVLSWATSKGLGY